MIKLFLLAVLAIGLLGQSQPSPVDLPARSRLLLAVTGDGAQIYSCTDGHWVLKAPDAKVLDNAGAQIGSHFAGPTWRLNDGSEVKGKAIANQPSPDAESIPWLLVQAVAGSGKGRFGAVTYIRRTDTHGGAAPKEACTGDTLSVPYSAKYSFYVTN